MAEVRLHFAEELARVERMMLEGLDMVVTQTERALEAAIQHDVELAQFVIEEDDRIDGRYMELHQSVLSLLALQAPVATDLRLVAALLHGIKHFERMGDQCVTIAKLVPVSGSAPPVDQRIVERIGRMGRQAVSQVRQAKAAFEVRDASLAEDLVRQDDEIDRLNREIFRIVAEGGMDPDQLEWGMTMLFVARAFERIGDNAVDIGEQVAFIVTGLFREFEDASHPKGPAPVSS